MTYTYSPCLSVRTAVNGTTSVFLMSSPKIVARAVIDGKKFEDISAGMDTFTV